MTNFEHIKQTMANFDYEDVANMIRNCRGCSECPVYLECFSDYNEKSCHDLVLERLDETAEAPE